jgi:hypothetical protein
MYRNKPFDPPGGPKYPATEPLQAATPRAPEMHAKVRAGEMLKEGTEQKQITAHGGNRKDQGRTMPTLKEIGISRDESSEFQRLASVPEHKLTAALEKMQKGDIPPTEAAVKPPKADLPGRESAAYICEKELFSRCC